MIKIGIIGDIGSGKSFAAKQFGLPIFDADKEVLKIYRKDKDCFIRLKRKIPKFITSFPIKKNELKKSIFENKANLKKIEEIVHPKVQKIMRKFIELNKKKKILIFDIPLLMENKNFKKSFVYVFVDSKKKDILKRLKKRKNYDKRIIENLRKSQLPLEFKRKKSHYVIKNDFKKLNLKKRVKIIKKKILNNHARSST